eukprot:4135191-Ditylum_brightwellii.AAC.1
MPRLRRQSKLTFKKGYSKHSQIKNKTILIPIADPNDNSVPPLLFCYAMDDDDNSLPPLISRDVDDDSDNDDSVPSLEMDDDDSFNSKMVDDDSLPPLLDHIFMAIAALYFLVLRKPDPEKWKGPVGTISFVEKILEKPGDKQKTILRILKKCHGNDDYCDFEVDRKKHFRKNSWAIKSDGYEGQAIADFLEKGGDLCGATEVINLYREEYKLEK